MDEHTLVGGLTATLAIGWIVVFIWAGALAVNDMIREKRKKGSKR